MLQSLATLIFAAAAIAATLLLAFSLSDEWASVRRALGCTRNAGDTPPLPRVRILQVKRAQMVQVSPGELKRAA